MAGSKKYKQEICIRKPWSISTTVRNPERLRNFLRVLKQLEGEEFNRENQIKYQIMLIQAKLYKPMRLTQEQKEIFEDPTVENIPYEMAEKLFCSKDYVDPAMRGRQSVNPLNKLGFSIAKEKMGGVKITNLGNLFISPDANVGHIFFKSLLKLQFSNPISTDFSEEKGFNVRPFIVAMHLMKKTEGLSKEEFFTPCYWPREKFKENYFYIPQIKNIMAKHEKNTFNSFV